jgi:hypothetical protein
VLPYLVLKKERAEQFLKAVKILNKSKTKIGGKRIKGSSVRPKEDVLEVIQIATSINNDRQTKRYREYKNFDYWKQRVEEYYA